MFLYSLKYKCTKKWPDMSFFQRNKRWGQTSIKIVTDCEITDKKECSQF